MFKVSVDELKGDKFKLRWREYQPVIGEDGKPKRKPNGKPLTKPQARSWTVTGKQARDETTADIIAALHQRGTWEPPTAPVVPTVCNLEVAGAKWLAFKATRCKQSSVDRFGQHMARWFGAMRAVRRLGPKDVVLGTAIDRDTYVECVSLLQGEGLSTGTVYGIARSALEMWTWAADDPKAYPGIVAPPRMTKAVLPRTPRYRSSTAPTIEELDACLRHISRNAPSSRRVGIIMRYTGLRIFQVLGILREDVDLKERTIMLRLGKSEAEQSEARLIPIADHLLAELRTWVIGVPIGSPVIAPAKAGAVKAKRRSETFSTAWQRATAAGEARERVWRPPNRAKARPEHAFRAALQGFWRRREVEEAVIDALVGHESGITRDKFYAGEELLVKMRRAVDLLPPIAWGEPERATGQAG